MRLRGHYAKVPRTPWLLLPISHHHHGAHANAERARIGCSTATSQRRMMLPDPRDACPIQMPNDASLLPFLRDSTPAPPPSRPPPAPPDVMSDRSLRSRANLELLYAFVPGARNYPSRRLSAAQPATRQVPLPFIQIRSAGRGRGRRDECIGVCCELHVGCDRLMPEVEASPPVIWRALRHRQRHRRLLLFHAAPIFICLRLACTADSEHAAADAGSGPSELVLPLRFDPAFRSRKLILPRENPRRSTAGTFECCSVSVESNCQHGRGGTDHERGTRVHQDVVRT